MIDRNELDYKLYYLILREGRRRSTNKVDSTFVSYKGTLFDITLIFDQQVDPVWFQLEDVIPVGEKLYPEFKTGTSTENPNGTVTFNDYGAGVMFLPSGFGYFNQF